MRCKILVVDDEEFNILFIQTLLKDIYTLVIANNGKEAVELAQKEKPNLILMDITMPVMDGIQACELIKSNSETADIPLIFLTALGGMDDESRGFDIGAVDYIHKPISAPLLLRRIKTHISLIRSEKLDSLARESIHMLGEAGHYNDTDTGVHIWRMAAFSARLASAVCWDKSVSEELEMAAPMHDTGKIGIPDSILKAERKLTADEWDVMKRHSQMGHDILVRSQHPVFQLAAVVALNHHEKWDGSGYPNGLSGEEIPQAARIVAIADVFDALTVKRPYKEAWPIDDALAYLVQNSGKHFDPQLVEAFMGIKDDILQIKSHWDAQDKKQHSGFEEQ